MAAHTPFTESKGTVYEGGFRAPAMIRWPGKVPAGKVENGIISGLDWFPTFVAAAGNPNIKEELLKGKKIGDRTYKNHLDGYNQLDMITGKGPSNRHEIFYFGGKHARRGAHRRLQVSLHRPARRLARRQGPCRRAGTLTNLRLDPFERTGLAGKRDAKTGRRIISAGSSTSSGASCSSSRKWRSWP